MNQQASISRRMPALSVLHVISSLDPKAGGPATAIMGLALAQAQAGLDVCVAATYGKDFDDRFAKQLREASIRVELIGPTRGVLAHHSGIQPALAEMIEKADIVHVHALWEEIQHQACHLARSLGKPYIVRPCGMLDPWSLAQSRWKKRLYMAWRLRRNLKQAAAIHFTTTIERNLAKPLKLDTASIVEPNGVSLAEFDELPVAGTFRAVHGDVGKRRILLFLSRLHPKKGLDLLIPAFAKVRPSDTCLVIAGPGDEFYERTVCRMVEAHDLRDDVVFTGMLHGRDRIAAMVDAELFVLPSYQENFGIVVIESLAAGTPVLISDQVNIHPEIAAASVGGVVATQVESLVAGLKQWLGDDVLRQRAADDAPAFVRRRFAWPSIAERWNEHYQQLTRR